HLRANPKEIAVNGNLWKTGALTILLLALTHAGSSARAQAPAAYPVRPVKVIVPVAAGGLQDTFARAIAQELTRSWGQSVLVESRPGANGIIAVDTVIRAAPDGYTVLMVDSSP